MRLVDVRLDDVVRLRKPHPCGANEWLVVRIGADIGLKCKACGRRVLLPRSQFNKGFKEYISRAPRSEEGSGRADSGREDSGRADSGRADSDDDASPPSPDPVV